MPDAPNPHSAELGTVITTFESPTTLIFHFVVQSAEGVRKGQFIEVQTSSGPLLASVVELARANRYFERAESVAEYERLGTLSSSFPTTEWEYTVATCRVHGVLQKLGENLTLQRASMPVAPGLKVVIAPDDHLKAFIGIEKDGLEIGNLGYHDLPVKLGMSKLLQKHLAILAMSGAGKSYLTGVLMEELLDRKAELGRLAIIVIDNHGEYIGFKSSQYGDRTDVVDGKKIKVGLRNLSAYQLAEWSDMSGTARRYLDEIFEPMKKAMKEKQEAQGLEELIEAVRADSSFDKKENVRGPLIAALDDLRRMRIIGKGDSPKLDLIVKPGHLAVFDLSEIDSLRQKQIIVAYFARKLFRMRKKGKIPPFLLVVEEAHNFAREKAEKHNALAKPVIETLAREGRKFGASLCLISQRPVQLSTTALSQCVTPDSKITLYDGKNAEIGNLSVGWKNSEILSYHTNTLRCEEKVPEAYLSKNPQIFNSPVFEIETESGASIRATGDHPFWAESGEWKPAGKLLQGERVAFRPLQDFKSEFQAEFSILSDKDIGVPSPVRKQELIIRLHELGLLPLTSTNPKLPILARLLGHIYGDGTLHPAYRTKEGQSLLRMTFSGKDEDLLAIQKDLGRLGFENGQKICKQKRESISNFIKYGPRKIVGISTYFKTGIGALWAIMKALGAPVGEKAIQPAHFPDWIMHSPAHIKREFLAAYTGSECSSIRFSRRWPESLILPFSKVESLQASGWEYAKQIQSLFSGFGISTHAFTRPYCKRKDGTYSIQFIIEIHRERHNVLRFCKTVGYRYARDKEELSLRALAYMQYLETMTMQKQQMMTVVQCHNGPITSHAARKMGLNPATARSWRSRNIQSAKLCTADQIPNFEGWVSKNCKGLGGGLHWAKISSILPVEATDVRDMTIPESHSFFANGFLTHNCNTQIILRVTNPFDIKHIGESCEGIDSNMLGSITTLRVGEALIVGEAVGSPVFVSVRKRRSRTPPKGDSLEKLAKQFEEGMKRKDDEIEAFL